MGERRLSDEDIDALANILEERFAERFYLNLGKGVWNVVWKTLVMTICAIAAYGYYKNS